MLAIGTNNAALVASQAVTSVQKGMETAMTRLSTGKRINSAADDAAGVAIASRLISEIFGTNQAIKNILAAQTVIDSAEGGIKEADSIVQRMRELAIQSASDTKNSTDRTNLNTEFFNLRDEITRIATTTRWAGTNLLDGTQSFVGLTFQIGTSSSSIDSIVLTIHALWGHNSGSYVGNQFTKGTGIYYSLFQGHSISTKAGASTLIDRIDGLISEFSLRRSKLAAKSNKLDYALNHLTNTANNLARGTASIKDADFAKETTQLAKFQILTQSSSAMLAQANASIYNVLALIND